MSKITCECTLRVHHSSGGTNFTTGHALDCVLVCNSQAAQQISMATPLEQACKCQI